MAKAKKYNYGKSLVRPFRIIDGQKRFDIEVTTKDVSIISNALKDFEKNKFISASNRRDVKKLFIFFDNLLEV